jgi:OPA family glycerol-3-phosphate transporter-like MFS transporter
MGIVLIGALMYWQSGFLSGGNLQAQKTIIYAALIIIGFCIYGPVALIGIQALNLVPKNAAGTAAGFVGLFGYLFGDAVLAKIGMGSLIQQAGWNISLMMFPIACLLAMILCALPWKSEKAML